MPLPPDASLQPLLKRYLAVRSKVEVLLWLALCAAQVAGNTLVTLIDVRRTGLPFAAWEVWTWELSSNLVWLALVPAVVWMLDRKPLHWGVLRRHLPWHALASVLACVLHVGAMVALRQAVYALAGARYAFGPWLDGLLYEGLKDVRSYTLIAGTVLAYRLLLWRWQGEARWLSRPDGAPTAPAPAPAARADPPAAAGAAVPGDADAQAEAHADAAGQGLPGDRLLVRKLGKEFLLPLAEIEWVQACGNYVNLHRDEHDYPLRATLAGIERRLAGAGFVRVHRSYLVNLALVQVIEPTDAGDARLRLRGGGSVPCSRTQLDALRQRLAAG